MFNTKALTLFHKTREQLQKEMERRGLSHRTPCSPDEMIANIIWKDAYDEGRNDEKRYSHCPVVDEKTSEYMLIDEDGAHYKMMLTDDQIAFWNWLSNNEMLNPNVEMLPFDETYTIVGRIKMR